jgi:hypothetical protein
MSRADRRSEIAAELIALRTGFCRSIDQLLLRLATSTDTPTESAAADEGGSVDSSRMGEPPSPRTQLRRKP